MDIGNTLKQIRKKAKVPQKLVAELLKIERSNYSKVENNKQKLTPEQIKIFCEYFNVSADYILDIKVDGKVVYDYASTAEVEKRIFEIQEYLRLNKNKK